MCIPCTGKNIIKPKFTIDFLQGFVQVNSKILTEEDLHQFTRLDTIQAVLPTVSIPLIHEVRFSPRLHTLPYPIDTHPHTNTRVVLLAKLFPLK